MNKKEVQQRVLQDGKPLDLDKFEWSEEARVFSTIEHNLVLDFAGCDGITFKTEGDCIFTTGSSCIFTTGGYCTFTTVSSCTFKTGSSCTFTTGGYCTFTTENDCTFKTGSSCTFTTRDFCVVVRRDVYEVIELVENKIIKLNDYGVRGFRVIEKDKKTIKKTITVDGVQYKQI